MFSHVFYKESYSLNFTRLFYSCCFTLQVSQQKYFLLFTWDFFWAFFFFVGNLKAVMVCGEENILTMSPCCSVTDFTWTQEWVLNKWISSKYPGEGTKGNVVFSSQFHLQGPCLGVVACTGILVCFLIFLLEEKNGWIMCLSVTIFIFKAEGLNLLSTW